MADPSELFGNALMMGVRQGREAEQAQFENALRTKQLSMAEQQQNALLPLQVQQAQMGIASDQARIQAIREQSRMQAQEYARSVSADQIARETAETRQALMEASGAYKAGDQNAWNATISKYGLDPAQFPMDNAPALFAVAEGSLEVWEGLTGGEKKPASVVALEMRAKAAGYEPGSAEYKAMMAEGDAPKTIINNNPGGVSDKFYQTLDTKQAETFGVLIDEGMKLPSKVAQLDQLDQLLSTAPSGVEGALKMAAGGLGIPTEGLDDLQAADAIINSLVPAQRPVGSGTMSDRDVEMFRQSLPRIINQPGGNKKIMDALRGVMIYQQRQAEIANKVAKRQMTPGEGMDALAQLENPLEQFKRSGPVKIGNYTIEEVTD